jgi:hypothetical protein
MSGPLCEVEVRKQETGRSYTVEDGDGKPIKEYKTKMN